ncbi:MAG: S8 family serine peptidase [Gemmataceae bacterium]
MVRPSSSRRKTRASRATSASGNTAKQRLTLEQLEPRNMLDVGFGPSLQGFGAMDARFDYGFAQPSYNYSQFESSFNAAGSSAPQENANSFQNDGASNTYDYAFSDTGLFGSSYNYDYPQFGYEYPDMGQVYPESEDQYPTNTNETGIVVEEPVSEWTWATITELSPGIPGAGLEWVTRETELTVTGHGTPQATLEVRDDSYKLANVTVDANGDWSTTVTLPGTTTLNVVDSNGTFLDSRSITVDTTPPEVNVSVPTLVKGTTVEVTVDVPPTSEDIYIGVDVVLDLDRNGDGQFSGVDEVGVASGQVWSTGIVSIPDVADYGQYSVQVTVSDPVGNKTSNVVSFSVDPHTGTAKKGLLEHLIQDYHISQILSGKAELWNYYNQIDPALIPYIWERLNSSGGSGIFLSAKAASLPASLSDIAEKWSAYGVNADGSVLIHTRSVLGTPMATYRGELSGLGMIIGAENAQHQIFEGWMDISKLEDLRELSTFAAGVPVVDPVLFAGSVPGDADPLVLADTFRTDFNATGAGITVGVLSDSYDTSGNAIDAAADIASGDLPGAGNPEGRTTPVNVLQDFPNGSDEGRAMLQIVHDLAPDASLQFRTAFNGVIDFAAGIEELLAAGSDVIVDDIGYLNSPLYNDGILNNAIDTVVAQGATYATAGGNSGTDAYESGWNGVTATVAGTNGTFHDFGGTDVEQEMTIPAGQFFTLLLQWDDAWIEGGSAMPNFQVDTDLALIMTDENGNDISMPDQDNQAIDQAYEIFAFDNTASATDTIINLSVLLNTDAAPPGRFTWIAVRGAPTNVEFLTGDASSMIAPSRAAGALTTAALNADTGTIEPFSSLGGDLEILFDDDGNALADPEIRAKPELTAPDNLNTTFFGFDSDGDGNPNFFGTSAAAPVVAGVAALILSDAGRVVTPTEMRTHLQENALDLETPGFDFISGSGLVQTIRLPSAALQDDFGVDDTSNIARYLGGLTSAAMTIEDLSIARHATGLHDYDWYSFHAAQSGQLNVTMDVTTVNGGDLHFRVYVLANGSLNELTSSRSTGTKVQSASTSVPYGAHLFVWVYGFNFEQGSYSLELSIT